MNSFPIKETNQNNIINKQKTSKIEIEYEKISPQIQAELITSEDSENFNVYFMKPDLKYKTISTSNSLTNSRIKTLNKSKKDSSKEKEFKSHLIQKLKLLKLNQKNKDKIPLNIASKIRREESIRNSLKYLLAKQAQYDPKKELLYYKAYFRFWKRKCKNEKYNNRRIIKKDKNIRITTVIYIADKPNKYKNNKFIEENKNDNNGKNNIFFRNKLIRIMENKSKEKTTKNKNLKNNDINNKQKDIVKNNNNIINNNINNNEELNINNIKTIKNKISIENKEIDFDYKKDKNITNNIHNLNKKYELTKIKKEALNKINNKNNKKLKKQLRNKSREKEGIENLNNIFLEKKKKYKEEIIKNLKQNKNSLDDYFNQEKDKWTTNKFNWQIEELSKDMDSLYGLSDEELKEPKNKNNININSKDENYNQNFAMQKLDNNQENFNVNNDNNDNKEININKISKNDENISHPLYDTNSINNYEEDQEEYEILSKNMIDNMEEEENNDYNEEEMNYEEMENNNNNYKEENLEEEYIDENEMEEMVEEEQNYNENGLNYLKDEVEEMMDYKEEEEENENENNEK